MSGSNLNLLVDELEAGFAQYPHLKTDPEILAALAMLRQTIKTEIFESDPDEYMSTDALDDDPDIEYSGLPRNLVAKLYRSAIYFVDFQDLSPGFSLVEHTEAQLREILNETEMQQVVALLTSQGLALEESTP